MITVHLLMRECLKNKSICLRKIYHTEMGLYLFLSILLLSVFNGYSIPKFNIFNGIQHLLQMLYMAGAWARMVILKNFSIGRQTQNCGLS